MLYGMANDSTVAFKSAIAVVIVDPNESLQPAHGLEKNKFKALRRHDDGDIKPSGTYELPPGKAPPRAFIVAN